MWWEAQEVFRLGARTGLLAVLSKSGVNRSTVSASDQHSTTRGTEKGMFARFYFPFCLHIDFKALTQKV